jgi:hypothetical protein
MSIFDEYNLSIKTLILSKFTTFAITIPQFCGVD